MSKHTRSAVMGLITATALAAGLVATQPASAVATRTAAAVPHVLAAGAPGAAAKTRSSVQAFLSKPDTGPATEPHAKPTPTPEPPPGVAAAYGGTDKHTTVPKPQLLDPHGVHFLQPGSPVGAKAGKNKPDPGLVPQNKISITPEVLRAVQSGTAIDGLKRHAPIAPSAASPAAASVPSAPGGVAGVARDRAVRVSWTVPTSDGGAAITGYTVTSNPGSQTATVSGATATSALVTGLTNGTAYTFTVVATNSVGAGPASVPSAPVTPQAAVAPGPVTNLTVAPGNMTATVAWTLPAADGGADLLQTEIDVFQVSTGGYLGDCYVNVPTTSCTFRLEDGVAYYVDVYVENSSGLWSPAAKSAQFTPKAGPQPAPPATVTATPGTSQGTASWTASPDDGGSPITGYVVTTYTWSDNSKVGSPATVGPGATSTVVTGLQNRVGYYFGIAAVNSAGTGPERYTAEFSPATAPTAPTAVTTWPSDGQAIVTWQEGDNGGSTVTGYTLIVSGPAGEVSWQSADSLGAVVAGLSDGVAYTFTVTATNAFGTSAASAPSSPTTPSSAYPALGAGLQQVPKPISTTSPSEKWGAILSGNGRYVFYIAYDDPDLPVFPAGMYGFARYDTVTGAKVAVSVDNQGKPMALVGYQYHHLNTGVSYDGSTAIFTASSAQNTEGVYVRKIGAGTTTLASPNAAGGETAGNIVAPQLSADGSTVAFILGGNQDMAQTSDCAGDPESLYRYSVASGTLSVVSLASMDQHNLPSYIKVGCGDPVWDTGQSTYGYASLALSGDGSKMAVLANIVTTLDSGGQQQSYTSGVDDEVVIWDAAAPTNLKWYDDGLYLYCAIANLCDLLSGEFLHVYMSADGSTVLASGCHAYSFTDTINCAGGPPNAVQILSGGTETYLDRGTLTDVDAMNSDGTMALSEVELGNGPSQVVAVAVPSGAMAMLSQLQGAPGSGESWATSGALSAAGDTAAFTTLAPNLMGYSGTADTKANVVRAQISKASFVPASQIRGCNCGDALSGAGKQTRDSVGDPINTATGAFAESVDDAALPGNGVSLDFRRSYDSSSAAAGPLGVGWSLGYGMALSTAANGDATVTADDGAQGTFKKMPDGSFRSAPGISSTLATTTSGYTLTTTGGTVYTFTAAGQLRTLTDRGGAGLTFGYTGSRLSSITDAAARAATLTYDGSGRVTLLTLSDGRTVGYGYDSSGRLSAVTGLDGKTVTYGYDAGNRLSSVKEPDGTTRVANTYDATTGRVTKQVLDTGNGTTGAATSTWDAAAQVATYTNALGGVTKDYYANNVLLKHVDPGGGTTSYKYDARLDVIAITDPDGNTTTMTYDALGRLLTKTAPAPISTTETWTYDDAGDVLTYTDGANAVTRYAYDSAHRLKQITDPLNAVTNYVFDQSGQLSSVTSPKGDVTRFAYDPAGDLLSTTDGTGAQTSYGYDAAGHRTSMVSPLGNVSGANPALFTTKYAYDSAGRLSTVTDPNGGVTTYAYDAESRQQSVRDPLGHTVSHTYDSFGRTLTTTDAAGHVASTFYDADGNTAKTVDGLGNTTTYAYDPADRLKTMVSPLGNVAGASPQNFTTTYGYDPAGNPTTVTDALKNVTTTAYDALGRTSKVTDALGNVTTTGYDPSGRVAQVRDALGNVSKKAYDPAGNLVSTTDPNGAVTGYTYDAEGHQLTTVTPLGETVSRTYDADGRVLTVTDPRGNVAGGTPAQYTTTNVYDVEGHLLQTTSPLGSVTKYSYDAVGNQLSMTDPLGNVTKYTYDADDRRTVTTDAAGKSTTTGYDALGDTLAETDALGDETAYGYDADRHLTSTTTARGNAGGADPSKFTTTYAYDANGNRTTVTDPSGAQKTTAYDADNRPVSVTDGMGGQTHTAYDADGNPVSKTDVSNRKTTSRYDADNRLTEVDDPAGNATHYGYDAAGNQTSMLSPAGETTTWGYDKDGRRTSVVDPRGNAAGADPTKFTVAYGYDPAGNQTTVTDQLGHTTTTAYDADGRVGSVTDPLGNATVRGYDADGRLTSVTDPTKNATTYGYDTVGNLLTRTDANGHVTTYGYDAAHRLTSVTDPLNRVDSYGYDADGNRVGSTDARGIKTAASVDGRGLVTGITYSDSTPAVTYAYDKDGRKTGVTDGTGSRTIGYDGDGRMLSVTAPLSPGKQFSYTYDPAGNLSARTFPDGEQTTYGYDADGRPTSETADGATVSYGYDPAGELTSTTLPTANGYTESRGYDQAGHLLSIGTAKTGSSLSTWQYSYDAAGRPTELDSTRGGVAAASQTYGYDNDGRLTSWCTGTTGTTGCPAGSPTVTYGYDNVGNRTSMVKAGRTTSYTYDAADELTLSVSGLVRQKYVYDADGNLTGNGSSTSTVTYDANNHPISAVQGSTSYTFVNDDAGNRVTTSANGALARTDLWDTAGPLPQLATSTDGTAALIGDYHADPLGLPQSEHTGSGVYYDAHDALGSVTDLTDASGADQYQYSYDPFGVATGAKLAAGAPDPPFGYAGQLKDQALAGKQDLRDRDYDPVTGRFTSTDAIQLRLDDPYVSAYVYGNDEPTRFTDPSGKDPSDQLCSSGSYLGYGQNCDESNDTDSHNFALRMAYDQEAGNYGAGNVYADLDGVRARWGEP